MRTMLIAAAAALAVASGAHAAGTKQVKDWLGVCANTGACTAFGFAPEEDENGGYLIIHRDGGPAAAPHVSIVFDPGDKQPAADWSLSLDGHPVAGVGPVRAEGSEAGARAELTGHAASALIAALRNGQSLEISAGGKSQVEISLAGSAAILLWVDDQQGRLDTVTALARPGAKPAASVPAATAPPLVAGRAARRPERRAGSCAEGHDQGRRRLRSRSDHHPRRHRRPPGPRRRALGAAVRHGRLQRGQHLLPRRRARQEPEADQLSRGAGGRAGQRTTC